MKRILILASVALLCSVAYAVGNDSHVTVVEDVSYDDLVKVNLPCPITVDYPALNDADQINPKFSSNINRLVKFQELGSRALCEGYTRVARGTS